MSLWIAESWQEHRHDIKLKHSRALQIMTPHSVTGKHRHHQQKAAQPRKIALAGTASSLNMHDLGPGELATKEWLVAGFARPELTLVREYSVARVREYLRKFDLTGIVLYTPGNVRYAK